MPHVVEPAQPPINIKIKIKLKENFPNYQIEHLHNQFQLKLKLH